MTNEMTNNNEIKQKSSNKAPTILSFFTGSIEEIKRGIEYTKARKNVLNQQLKFLKGETTQAAYFKNIEDNIYCRSQSKT